MQLRFASFFVSVAIASGGSGCALFFDDQAAGAGGSGGGAPTTSVGGSSSVSTGGGGAGGEGGNLPACPGVQRDGTTWLATYAQTRISGFDRSSPGGRMSFVGTAEGGAHCGLAVPTGQRVFYAELTAIDGENLSVFDLGEADDAEVVLASGHSNSDKHVLWRRGNLLCMNRQSSESSLAVTEANPCGTNPKLHCTVSTSISELHAAASSPPIVGFRAQSAGQLDCIAPAGVQRAYTTGPVLVLASSQPSQLGVYTGSPLLSQVRSSGVGSVNAEARIVGWCPAGSMVGAYACAQDTYFQAFASDSNLTFGSVEALGTTYSLLSPGGGIHPHAWGYAFTTADGAQRVLQWGTESNASAGLTIPYEAHANDDPQGRETLVLGASFIGNAGQALLTGELASAIVGAVACPAEAGTCAFVMRANLGEVTGGVLAHPAGPTAADGRAWATHAQFVTPAVLWAGGYRGAPLALGRLVGLDPGDGQAAFIARGEF